MMNRDYLYQVILGTIVSEKSTFIGEKNNQYAFLIEPKANKADVKAAVELLFKVNVKSVQILNITGKKKRFGRYAGKHKDVRKAYVSIAEGQEIKFTEVN